VRVGKAYKCPQMNPMKFLVHKSFEFRGVLMDVLGVGEEGDPLKTPK